MSRKGWVVLIALVVVAAGWYAFRPERLFVSQKVNEQFPAATEKAAKTGAPVALASGNFHGVSRKTMGVATIYRLPDGKRTLRLTNFENKKGDLMSANSPVCPRCNLLMALDPQRLDLSWAGDGPNAADAEFRGIFAEVHRCPYCRAQIIRPVSLEFSSPRLAVAS